MRIFCVILSVLVGYLLGSVSISILLSKYVYHQDVRQVGSGNAGATNAARVFGMQAGVLTFLGDFAKTALAMGIGWLLDRELGFYLAGGFALIGHCFPVYFRFRGGKAVSAGAAVALLLDWRIFLAAAVVFGIMVLLTKTASICSMGAALAVGIGAFVFDITVQGMILACFACVLVIFMHRSNIGRIFKGTEPKFSAGKKS